MKTNRISIIGGTGFLGKSLERLFLNKKYNFQILDKNPLNQKNHGFIDILNRESIKILKNTSTIIHLAAEHKDNIRPINKYYKVNVTGAENVCEAAEKFNIDTIIFTSSVAIYGFAPANTAEDGDINYFNEYGRTKYLAEKVFINWQKKQPNTRTLIIIRPTVIFGEGNRGNVFNLISQIKNKRFFMIGNGQNKKSMAYVENVSAFIDYCLKMNKGIHIYNYVDKPDMTMNELVSKVRRFYFTKENVGLKIPLFLGFLAGYFFDFISTILRKSLPVSSIRIKKFVQTTQFDSSISKLNFQAPYSLEEGLYRTMENDMKNFNHNQNHES